MWTFCRCGEILVLILIITNAACTLQVHMSRSSCVEDPSKLAYLMNKQDVQEVEFVSIFALSDIVKLEQCRPLLKVRTAFEKRTPK